MCQFARVRCLTSCCAVVGLCRAEGVSLPTVCHQRRADKNSTLDVPDVNCTAKVRRSFFHPTIHCKTFSLCSSKATYLDQFEVGSINYFQNKNECSEFCSNSKLLLFLCSVLEAPSFEENLLVRVRSVLTWLPC